MKKKIIKKKRPVKTKKLPYVVAIRVDFTKAEFFGFKTATQRVAFIREMLKVCPDAEFYTTNDYG